LLKILVPIFLCATPIRAANDLMRVSKLITHETRMGIDVNDDRIFIGLIGEFNPVFKHFERPVWRFFKNAKGCLIILGSQLSMHRLIRVQGQQLDVYSVAIPNLKSKQIQFDGESFDFCQEAEYGLPIE
jgi:hypothetical protein